MADVTIPLPGRRAFLRQSALGLAALATLFNEEGRAAAEQGQPGLPASPRITLSGITRKSLESI